MNRNDRHTRPSRTDDRQTGTDRRDRTDGPITDGSTMCEVSHTHPFTDRGALNRVFERGTRVAADGGERNAGEPERREADARNPDADENSDADDEASAETREMRMKDIDHTPPHGEDVSRVFERGGKEEPVEAEE